MDSFNSTEIFAAYLQHAKKIILLSLLMLIFQFKMQTTFNQCWLAVCKTAFNHPNSSFFNNVFSLIL